MPSAVTASMVRGPGRVASVAVGTGEVLVEEVLRIARGAEPGADLVFTHARLADPVAELPDQVGLVLQQVSGLIGRGQRLAGSHLDGHLRGERGRSQQQDYGQQQSGGHRGEARS